MTDLHRAAKALRDAAQGYQRAIHEATGKPHPWPALELAYDALRAALDAPPRGVTVEEVRDVVAQNGEHPIYRDGNAVGVERLSKQLEQRISTAIMPLIERAREEGRRSAPVDEVPIVDSDALTVAHQMGVQQERERGRIAIAEAEATGFARGIEAAAGVARNFPWHRGQHRDGTPFSYRQEGERNASEAIAAVIRSLAPEAEGRGRHPSAPSRGGEG